MRFAFGLRADGLFFVMADTSTQLSAGTKTCSWLMAYPDEDEFLRLVVNAGLQQDEERSLLSAVVVGISKSPAISLEWIDVDLTLEQIEKLGLNIGEVSPAILENDLAAEENTLAFDPFKITRLIDVMMQSPTPFCILTGPEHRFAFINAPYMRILQRTSISDVLGKTIREVLPDLKGQVFFNLLDRVYSTGEAYVGRRVLAVFFREATRREEEAYFDFVYQPMFDVEQNVVGIMVQSTDVTAQVLAEQTMAQREQMLFRQWSELEAIYRAAPIGLALIDVEHMRILRVNPRQADFFGTPAADLLGKNIFDFSFDLYPTAEAIRELFARAAAGETIEKQFIGCSLHSSPETRHCCLVTFTPAYGPSGEVYAVTVASTEMTTVITAPEEEHLKLAQ